VSYYLRSLAWHLADVSLPPELEQDFRSEVAPFVAGADAPTAVTALVLITLVSLLVSASIIHRRQWPLTEGV
jgi:hypothetical protein